MARQARYPHVWKGVVTFALMAVLLAGCSDADEPKVADETPAPEQTSVSHDVFCESAVAMEDGIFRTATGREPLRPVQPLVDQVEASAPAELESEVAAVVEAARQTLSTGDDAALRDPAFGTSEEHIDAWITDNCGFETVEVSAVEYAFEGVPNTVPAGISTFHFRNDGAEAHEMLTVRLKDEAVSARDLTSLSEEEASKAVEYIGSAFAGPGVTDADSRDLAAGRYALVCLLPIGEGAPDDPSHFDRGMWAEFTVK